MQRRKRSNCHMVNWTFKPDHCLRILLFIFIIVSGFLFCLAFGATEITNVTVINRAIHNEPESIDPQKIQSNPAINIVNDLFEGLVTRDRAGHIIPGQSSRWQIAKDFKTYTFHLRVGQWSDGTPLTAADFVYAWRRAVTPSTASPYAWYLQLAGIKNAKAITEGKMSPETLGVKAVNKETLQVSLYRSVPWFLTLLTHPVMFPVPKHVLIKYGNDWTKANHMVSNGAYILKSRIVNSQLTLEANPFYRDAKDVSIHIVNWIPVTSATSAMHRFSAGGLDITYAVPSNGFNQLKKKFGKEIVTLKQAGIEYLTINNQKPPFNNRALRQALSYAIDRKVLVKHVLGQGQMPAYQFTPPYLVSAPDKPPFYETLSDKTRIKLAKKKYKAAGYSKSHPLKIAILYNTDETRKKLLLAIAYMWKMNLGIDVSLENMEWKTLLDNIRAKKFEVARASWIADYNEAASMLGYFSGDQTNKAGFHNKQYDTIMTTAFDQAPHKRIKLYESLEQILAKEMPVIPLYFYVSPRLVSKKIGGYYSDPLDQILTRYLWIRKT